MQGRWRKGLALLLALTLCLLPAAVLAEEAPDAPGEGQSVSTTGPDEKPTGQVPGDPEGNSSGGDGGTLTVIPFDGEGDGKQEDEGMGDGGGEPNPEAEPEADAPAPRFAPASGNMTLEVTGPAGTASDVQDALDALRASGIQVGDITEVTVTGTALELDGLQTLAEELTALEVLHMPEQRVFQNVSRNQSPFYNHPTLQTLDLPKASFIGDYFFQGCASLQSLNLPLVEKVGTGAFEDCTDLRETVELPAATELHGLAFLGCSNLTGISLPEVGNIGSNCFAGCTSLESVHIPKVTNVEMIAFYGCTSLTSISLPKVTVLKERVFGGCTSLETIDAPLATRIQVYVFENCTSLVSVSFLEVKEVYRGAFQGCTSLESVDLLSVEKIYMEVFAGCTSLVSVRFPAATMIDESVFEGCTSLASVDLPAVEEIGDSAFQDCTALEGIVLPDTLTSVGYSAFEGSGLNHIVFLKDSPPSFGTALSDGIFGLSAASPGNSVQVWVPSASVSAYRSALYPDHINDATRVQGFDAATDLPQTIVLDPTLALFVGEEKTLSATVTPSTLGMAVFWSSSNPAIATVDQTGKVTGVSAGNATITAASVLDPSVSATCAVTVDVATAAITLSANPSAGGTVSGDGTVALHAEHTVNALPNGGWEFVNWTENGNTVSSDAAYTFAVQGDRALVANFRLKPTPPTSYAITVSADPAEGGTVTGSGSYEQGEACTVNALPNGGWEFVNWTENGNAVSSDAAYTFAVQGDRALAANFRRTAGGGSGAVSGGGNGGSNVSAPAGTAYAVDGDAQTWSGGAEGLTFTVQNLSPASLLSVAVDGVVLDPAQFTVREGSVILTLPASYLGTLSTGAHTLSMQFWNGSATATFEVRTTGTDTVSDGGGNGGSVNDNPATGGPQGRSGAAWALALAAAGGVLLCTRRKR